MSRPFIKTRAEREGTVAGFTAVERLTRRAQFLRVARKGKSAPTSGLVLQACVSDGPENGISADERPRGAQSQERTIRVGFTASRKVGGAVVRNRCRRRLRALVREIFPDHAAYGYDYVIIARAATAERPYPALGRDLKRAMKRLELWRDTADKTVQKSPSNGGCGPSSSLENSGAGRS